MTLRERDAAAIWHPYTQMKLARYSIPIVRAEGVYLYDADGRPLIDAVSSWWVNLHGHGHPYIAEKVYQQLKTLDHVIFAGVTHPVAIEFAERLLAVLPANQSKIFYSDNGSTAVEVALKMAIQYWHNHGCEKKRIIYLEGAYHGDTFGAMASSARSAFTRPFQAMLFETFTLPLPNAENIQEVIFQLESALQTGDIAAFIFEPMVQGVAGFRFYGAEYLDKLLQICRAYKTPTIADEVMTGFGRTGPIFASAHPNEHPDIICLSKGITGGVMPLAVTSCTAYIYDAFLSDDKSKTFFHGHSYTANAVACAAACASLDLLDTEDSLLQRQSIAFYFQQAIARLTGHPKLANIRSLGPIFAVELVDGKENSYFNNVGVKLTQFFLRKGVLIRPLGNTFYLIPPYCITTSQLDTIFAAFEEFLQDEYH